MTPIISITEARQILGLDQAHLKDKDVENAVMLIYNVCRDIIKVVINKPYGK